MKILIYKADIRSFFGLICSLITGSAYSHAAISQGGRLYDATLQSGRFRCNVYENLDLDRQVVCFNFPEINCTQWLNENLNKKYDLIGLLLWPLGFHQKDKMYCFEVADNALKSFGIDVGLNKRKSGGKIIDGLIKLGYKGYICKLQDCIKNPKFDMII